MDWLSIVVLALSLAMDAIAVSVSCGAVHARQGVGLALKLGLIFGGFQAGMPMAGWIAGNGFRDWVIAYSHWAAFGILLVIGLNMIREAVSGDPDERHPGLLTLTALLLLGVATSIDALAVGVSLGMLGASVLLPAAVIGGITGVLSAAGARVGNRLGERHRRGMEITGGVMLILIGCRMLYAHGAG